MWCSIGYSATTWPPRRHQPPLEFRGCFFPPVLNPDVSDIQRLRLFYKKIICTCTKEEIFFLPSQASLQLFGWLSLTRIFFHSLVICRSHLPFLFYVSSHTTLVDVIPLISWSGCPSPFALWCTCGRVARLPLLLNSQQIHTIAIYLSWVNLLLISHTRLIL
jgi:hypothetical protein